VYEIRVDGQLGDSWSPWLGGMAIHRQESGQTVLCGPLPDEPALHGVLARIRDLGLPLLEVKRLAIEISSSQQRGDQQDEDTGHHG
jgi:hypothetical protein